MTFREFYIGQIALQVIVKDIVVVVGIMSKEYVIARIFHESRQCLLVRQQLMVLPLLYDWIDDVAKHCRNRFVGLYVNGELRTGNYLSTFHLDSRYLQDVILMDIKSRRLGVKHDYLLVLVCMGKVHDITAVLTDHEVGGQERTVKQLADERPRRRILLIHMQSFEQSCPGYEIMFVGKHRQMSQQEFHLRHGEHIRAAHLKVAQSHLVHTVAYDVGITV